MIRTRPGHDVFLGRLSVGDVFLVATAWSLVSMRRFRSRSAASCFRSAALELLFCFLESERGGTGGAMALLTSATSLACLAGTGVDVFRGGGLCCVGVGCFAARLPVV